MSSCSWSAAPLPIRTGREPRQPSKWSRVSSVRSERAVDPVHDLQRPGAVAGLLGRRGPAAICRTAAASSGVAQAEQRVDGERAVPDPGVAVVPVALAADLLGQPGGRRRDQRAGRRVGHQLERHRRAGHHLAPAAGVGRPVQPVAPEARGLVGERLRLLGRDQPLRRAAHRLQHDAADLALAQRPGPPQARRRPARSRAPGRAGSCRAARCRSPSAHVVGAGTPRRRSE